MNSFFIVDTSNGAAYYAIFNLASLLLGTAMAFYSGFKRGFPVFPWTLIMLTGGLFYLLGNKLITYSSLDWKLFLTTWVPPTTTRKVILGGIAGLVAGLLLAKAWFRFRAPVLDQYAVALPLSMAISRIGCLKAGCCFGTITDVPWAIHYMPGSYAFKYQLLNGQAQFGQPLSAAVHPVQVYEMTGCFLIAFFAWKMRKRFKAPGSLFLFSMLCYAGLRFLVEFVRSPDADLVMGNYYFGLKGVQWLSGSVLMIGSIILAAREFYFKSIIRGMELCHATKFRQVILVIVITSIALFMRELFTPKEYVLIMVILVPLNLYMLGRIIHWIARAPHFNKIKPLDQRRS